MQTIQPDFYLFNGVAPTQANMATNIAAASSLLTRFAAFHAGQGQAVDANSIIATLNQEEAHSFRFTAANLMVGMIDKTAETLKDDDSARGDLFNSYLMGTSVNLGSGYVSLFDLLNNQVRSKLVRYDYDLIQGAQEKYFASSPAQQLLEEDKGIFTGAVIAAFSGLGQLKENQDLFRDLVAKQGVEFGLSVGERTELEESFDHASFGVCSAELGGLCSSLKKPSLIVNAMSAEGRQIAGQGITS